MSWIGEKLELQGVSYEVSYRLTFSKPGGGGELYVATDGERQVCLGLSSPGSELLTPDKAQEIKELSQDGCLPIQTVAWWGEQPVYILGLIEPVPLDQARWGVDWSPRWAAEQISRLAHAADRFHEELGSAARVQMGRIAIVEPGHQLLLVPPLRLNAAPAAKSEDIRQLALVTAWLLTGALLTPETVAIASGVEPATRIILQDACAGQYRRATDFADALAMALVATAPTVALASPRATQPLGSATPTSPPLQQPPMAPESIAAAPIVRIDSSWSAEPSDLAAPATPLLTEPQAAPDGSISASPFHTTSLVPPEPMGETPSARFPATLGNTPPPTAKPTQPLFGQSILPVLPERAPHPDSSAPRPPHSTTYPIRVLPSPVVSAAELPPSPARLRERGRTASRFSPWLLLAAIGVMLLVPGFILWGRGIWSGTIATPTADAVAIIESPTVRTFTLVPTHTPTYALTPTSLAVTSAAPQATLPEVTLTITNPLASPAVASTKLTATPSPASRTPPPAPPTPTATRAPSSTPSAIPPSPTRSPTPKATTPPPPPAPPVASYPVPVLMTPAADLTVSGLTTFVWRWDGPALAANQAFEVRLWKESQSDHFGAAEPVRTTSAAINVRGAYGVKTGGSGTYFWTVALVEVNPYRRIGDEAPKRTIFIRVDGPTVAPP